MAGNARVANRMEAAAALMRQRGLQVGAFAGWRDAGRSSTMNPRAVTCHHTAAAVDIDRMLRDGRSDLPGPLCNWALHRDGSWWLVASGRANHAGVGVLPSSESYGIEATGPVPVGNTGPDAFPNYQQYVTGVACILLAEGWEPGVVYAHKETARPDGRKPDPAFGSVFPAPYRDMDRFRGQVKAAMSGRDSGQGEDDMTPEQAGQLQWIHDNLRHGHALADTPIDNLFGNADRTHDALVVPGTTSAEEAFNLLFARVRTIEQQVKVLVDALGPVEPPPPPPA
jgi:N-acetylmuramoyl-L-alanine amidase